MWQRIQTLYLIIASLVNLTIYFFNLAYVEVGELSHRFEVLGLMHADTNEITAPTYLILLALVLSVLMSWLIIFLYKKRQLQIKLAQLNLFLQIVFIAVIFFGIDAVVQSASWHGDPLINYSLGTYLSLVPIVFIFLAIKSIKKDEALVRAADRIR